MRPGTKNEPVMSTLRWFAKPAGMLLQTDY